MLEDGRIAVLDALPVKRNARAAVRIAVDLAKAGVITRPEALLRIEPRSLIEHLHPQIDPAAPRDVFGSGIAASPGAATGRVVFTADAAEAAAARGEATILVRLETSPEDIRGMHAARGVADHPWRHVEPRRRHRPRHRAPLRRRLRARSASTPRREP